MNTQGKWILLQDDEDFDPARNRVVAIGDQQIVNGKLIVDLSPSQRLVMSKFDDEGAMAGCYYWTGGGPLPEGDPARLWRELEETADEDDPRWDDLPHCDYARLYRVEGGTDLPVIVAQAQRDDYELGLFQG